MADIPGNSTTGATITVGGLISGELEAVGDQDWFRLQLTAGQQVTILLTGLTLEDPYLRIRDSAGNLIFERDDISPGVIRDSRISFTAPSSGTFYVDVGAWTPTEPVAGYTGTGTYELSVEPYTPPEEWSTGEVAEFLASGYWNGESHPFDVTQGGTITVNVTALTPAGRALALTALDLWSDIIDVNFVQVTTGGQIVFDDNEDGAFADNVWADGFSTSATVNVDVDWLDRYGTDIGSYSLQTYIHEVGHALGLGHAGYYNSTADYFSDAEYANDGWPMTVMSYFSQNESDYFDDRYFTYTYIATPMIADIAAMELLYGLSTTTRAGDTTYGFNSTAGDIYNAALHPDIAYTIFDSGGVDTLNYSGFRGSLINLTPGSFSNLDGMTGTVAIGAGVIIENAIGGSEADYIIGNFVDNRLDGGGGPMDTVSYETATSGVTVNLQLTGAQNTGGAGTDTLLNFENLIGSSHDDVLAVRAGYSVYGGDGNDVIDARLGGGNLNGQAGNDRFLAPTHHITIDGGEGWDIVDYSSASTAIAIDLGRSGYNSALTSNIEEGIGSAFDDTLTGDAGVNILSGGGGSDRLFGGGGSDTFRGSAADLNGDVLTDFTSGDRILITDATLSTFTYSVSGATLSFGSSALTLSGGLAGTLVASAASEGGVQLTLGSTTPPPPPPPPVSRARLILTETGQDFTIGGNIAVFGTTGPGEAIRIVRGNISLDASFNAGGDTVVLPGDAASYTASLSGSSVVFSGGDINVAIPVGPAGIVIRFNDGAHALGVNPGTGQVLIGDQIIGPSALPVAPTSQPVTTVDEPNWEGLPITMARLILTESGQDADIGGNAAIFGTSAAGEVVSVIGGTIQLDASFNAGGDTVALPGPAADYTASLSGSFVTITDGDLSVAIPVGVPGLTVDFADVNLTLRIDTATGQVVLGDDVVMLAGATAAAPTTLGLDELFDEADVPSGISTAKFDSFEQSTVSLEVDSFHFG